MSERITELEQIVLDDVLDELGGPLTPDAHRAALIATHRVTAMILEMSDQIQYLEARCLALRQFIA